MIIILKQGSTQKLINELMEKLFKKKKARGIDVSKYCGVLKLEQDALTIQQELRDEWG